MTSSTLSTDGSRSGSRTTVSRRARSGRSSVTVKKKRRAATALLITVGVVFAVGECLVGVVQGPLVADLAPERLRGRYTALWLTTSQFGFTLGPAVGGLLLAHSATLLWLVSAGVCVACSAAAVVLGRVLPTAARLAPISPQA